MKKYLLIILLFPQLVDAHCPLKFTVDGNTFCTEAQWLPAEQKSKGNWVETQELSPQLIPSGQIPPLWLYSKVSFLVWKHGETTHTPQRPQNLRVFPMMSMVGMHPHSASYQFAWNDTTQTFILSGLALQSMKGCWSFYLTTEKTDDPTTSQKLFDVADYVNLDKDENSLAASYCEDSDSSEGMEHQH